MIKIDKTLTQKLKIRKDEHQASKEDLNVERTSYIKPILKYKKVDAGGLLGHSKSNQILGRDRHDSHFIDLNYVEL